MTVAAAAVPSSPSRRNRRRRGGAAASAPPATFEDDFSAPLPSAPKSPSKRRSAVVEQDEASPPVTVPGTPPKKSKSGRKGRGGGRGRPAAAAAVAIANVVTPSETPDQELVQALEDAKAKNKKNGNARARRSLSANMRSAASLSSSSSLEEAPSLASSSSQSSSSSEDESSSEGKSTITKKGPFGRTVVKTPVLPVVKSAYSSINTRTGSLGGNGHGGAIYGELTVGSMQKMVDLMKEHTNFSSESRFIDVGCGLGKPNVHVALDPAVEFSYGCEMEGVRWWLAMSNLDAVLQGMNGDGADEGTELRCMLAHADITEAKSFDPFTHVYMFDIGFPPALFYRLAKVYNNSVTPEYLICYHGPRLMIDEYGFDLELLAQTSTSMHGSSEGHMGYVYKRIDLPPKAKRYHAKKTGKAAVPCDPLFRPAYNQVRDMSRSELGEYVREVVSDNFNGRNDGGDGNSGGESNGPRRSRRTKKPITKYGADFA